MKTGSIFPLSQSPIWDVIFSWTLNPLSGAVSKTCCLTTQHTVVHDHTEISFLSAWKKGFKSFLPHLLLYISVHQQWEKLFTASCSAPHLARSHSPPPLLICLGTNAKVQDGSLPSSSAHSAVSLGNGAPISSSPSSWTMLVCQVSAFVIFSSSLYPILLPGISLVLVITQFMQSIE